MSQPDDYRPRKRSLENELSATVPDIFAPTYLYSEIPEEFTSINLMQSGCIKFPGLWKKDGLPESKGFYQSRECLVAFLEIGDVRVDADGAEFLQKLLAGEPTVFSAADLEKLKESLSLFRPKASYELSTASLELLNNRVVIVVQGYFLQSKTKEAFIVFPNTEGGVSFFSLRAPKLEFLIFFNHLRYALKTVEWNN